MNKWVITVLLALVGTSGNCLAHDSARPPASRGNGSSESNSKMESKIVRALSRYRQEQGIDESEDRSVELGSLFVRRPKAFVKTAIRLGYSSGQVASFLNSLSPDYVDAPCKSGDELSRREHLLLSIEEDREYVVAVDKDLNEEIKSIMAHCDRAASGVSK